MVVLPNHGGRKKAMNMKKCFAFLVTSVALAGSGLIADYVAQDFDALDTGKKTVFWGDASGGKDAYVLRWDKNTDKYYFDQVEKNKPEPKKAKDDSVSVAEK